MDRMEYLLIQNSLTRIELLELYEILIKNNIIKEKSNWNY